MYACPLTSIHARDIVDEVADMKLPKDPWCEKDKFLDDLKP